MLEVMGRNRRAAIHAGMPVAMLITVALLLSGGFAGLAGANDVLGVQGLFKGNWNPGYGFTAFALVYLARLNSLLLVPFAFFFSFLLVGGESMPRRADIPTYFIEMLEGLMLLCFAVAVYLERRWTVLHVPSQDRARVDALQTSSTTGGTAMTINGIDLTDFLTAMLATGIMRAVPLVVTSWATRSLKESGQLNLGIEGMMLAGCFFGFHAAYQTESLAAGMVAGTVAGLRSRSCLAF